MALFEYDQGRLVPAQFGRAVEQGLTADILESIRAQVLEVVARPLFPVTWHNVDISQTNPEGGPRVLTALDAAGQVVSVEIMARLDAVSLTRALARVGRLATLGWMDLASSYPGGPDAFRAGWADFKEAMPSSLKSDIRLIIVTGELSEDVRPALSVLRASGVEICEVQLREMSSGRQFIEVHRLDTDVLGIGGFDQIGGHVDRPELALTGEVPVTEPAPAPDMLPEPEPEPEPEPAAETEPEPEPEPAAEAFESPDDPVFEYRPDPILTDDTAIYPPIMQPADEQPEEPQQPQPLRSWLDLPMHTEPEPAPAPEPEPEPEPGPNSDDVAVWNERANIWSPLPVQETAQVTEETVELADMPFAEAPEPEYAEPEPIASRPPSSRIPRVTIPQSIPTPTAIPVTETDEPEQMFDAVIARAEHVAAVQDIPTGNSDDPRMLKYNARALATLASIIGDSALLLYRDSDGQIYEAMLGTDGVIDCGEGFTTDDPSVAFTRITGKHDVFGWDFLHIGNLEGPTLSESVAEVNREIERRTR